MSTIDSPTITYYQQLADDLTRTLDRIAASIPQLESIHPATANFVRSHANIPIPFLVTAVAAVEQTPELQGIKPFAVDSTRDAIQFNEAFRPVYDKMTAFANSISFTMASLRAHAAADALQIYAIAKGLARDPGGANVHVHVRNLKRDLGRSGKPRGAKKGKAS